MATDHLSHLAPPNATEPLSSAKARARAQAQALGAPVEIVVDRHGNHYVMQHKRFGHETLAEWGFDPVETVHPEEKIDV
jgi:lauroyl/myristoyl acyltransferase